MATKKNNRCHCGGLIKLERYLQDRYLICTACGRNVHFIAK